MLRIDLLLTTNPSPLLDALDSLRETDEFVTSITGPCGYRYTLTDVQIIESWGFYLDEHLGIVADPDDDRCKLVAGWYYDGDSACVRPVMNKANIQEQDSL